jgi:hypothetical protein
LQQRLFFCFVMSYPLQSLSCIVITKSHTTGLIGWAPKLSNQNESMPNIFGKCALTSNQLSAKILAITFS